MKKNAILILSLLLLVGCSSAPVRSYFQIASPAAKTAAPAIERTLLIETVDVDQFYNDFRIVYRISPYELRFYSNDFWIKKPSQMFRDAAASLLGTGRFFSDVTTDLGREDATLVLKMKVRVIEEVDGPKTWRARLAMEIEFRDKATGAILVARSFERAEPMPEKNVKGLPEVLSIIFTEELGKAVEELPAKLGARTGN